MRYYIPTTILNIGNLLSSDSISPESFYKNRGFGNPHWYDVEENNMPNVILLYKHPFRFCRPQSELEDRPVLITIESSEEFIFVNDEVVACDHTIYFDWNTEFIFFCQADKISALSLMSIGITTKMTMLYKEKRMKVEEQLPVKRYQWDLFNHDLNREALSSEYILNKLQGLIYGYYIGALLTTTPQNVGGFSSLKSTYDALVSELSTFLGKSQKKDVLEIVKITKECILNEIDKVKNAIDSSHRPLPISSNEISIEKGKVAKISNKIINQERKQKLFLDWINNILIKNNWGNHVNSIKSSLADELTDEAIKVWGDAWTTSETRAFLNDLRHHLAGEAFHHEWNNGLLSSLAAFLINGDDWENMLLFMQKKGIYDYRLAFALWGTFVGFADMPRTFTDLLFNQEKLYIKEFYDEVYFQIHGTRIEINQQIQSDKHYNSLSINVYRLWEIMPAELKKNGVKDKLKKGIDISINRCESNLTKFLSVLKEQKGFLKDSGVELERWKYFESHLNSMFLNE